MCSKYEQHHPTCRNEHNWEGPCDRLKKRRIVTLMSYNSTPVVTLEAAISLSCNC